MHKFGSSIRGLVAFMPIAFAAILAPYALAAAPTITGLMPSKVHAGWPTFTLTVEGKNFIPASKVYWGEHELNTKFDDAELLTATVPADLIAKEGAPLVTVSEVGVRSKTSPVTIEAQKPLITRLSPSSVSPGGPELTLTIDGADFLKNATTVNWRNSTTGAISKLPIVSETISGFNSVLKVTVPKALIETAGTASVTVTTPAGGTSQAATFAAEPKPSITSLTPKSASVGWPAFTLTVAGKNFVTTSKVLWGAASTPLVTKFVSAAQLTASVPAKLIATKGAASVTVSNAGVKSAPATFTIEAAKPLITSLSPAAVAPGHATFTLTISGADFVPGHTTVSWKSAGGAVTPLTPTSVTATSIKVTVLKSLVAKAGSATVTVTTSTGTSSSPFTIAPPPTVTKLSQISAVAGDLNLTLTISGSNFIKGTQTTQVVWKTGTKITTIKPSVNSTTAITLPSAVTAPLLVNAGTKNILASVTVTTPVGSSKAETFTIEPVKPVISGLSPTTVTAGSAVSPLKISGYNFATGATVNFGAHLGIKPISISSTLIDVTIPASDTGTAGPVSVTVKTARGTSAPISFDIKPKQTKLAITSLSQTMATSGGPGFTLTVNGTDFVNAHTILYWLPSGGSSSQLDPIPGSYSGTTQFKVQVPANLIANPGTATVWVTTNNPAATSNKVTFKILQAPPVIANNGLFPNSIAAGQTSNLVLKISGTNLIKGAIAYWTPAGSTATALQTTAVGTGNTTLDATVPKNLLAEPGSANITVVTSAGTSNAERFTISPTSGPACTNDGSGNTKLNGVYSFEFTQVDLNNNGNLTRNVGTFSADGSGGITAGIEDSNGAHLAGAVQNTAFTGSYSVGADDRGLLTINYTGGPTTYFCFALDSFGASSVAGSARLVSDATETLVSSGSFYAQGSANITAATVGGSWVMGIEGTKLDPSNGNETRGATAGYFTLDGTSKVTAGEADISQDQFSSGKLTNNSKAQAAVTGSYAMASTGRGTLTLSYGGAAASHYVFYVAGTNKILILSTDAGGKGGSAVMGGQALQRPSSITFGDGTLSGSSVFIDQAFTNTTATQYDHRLVQAGIISWNGSGSYSEDYDQNDAGVVSTLQSTSSTYSVDSAGRVTIKGTTPSTFGYLVNTNAGFAISGNLGVSALYFEGQATGGFNLASFSGNYSEGSIAYQFEAQKASSGEVDANGSGSLTGSLDVAPGLIGCVDCTVRRGFGVEPDWSRPRPRDLSLSETYATSSVAGRLVILDGTKTVQALYLVSPDKAFAIDIGTGDTWQTLEVFNHQ